MISLGLIGYPLGHSFSARYFNEKFEREGISGHYDLYPIRSIDELPSLLAQHPELSGLNVTIPYKEQIIPLLDEISENAQKIGAVNVVRILRQEDGTPRLTGYNSDTTGFSDSLAPLLRPDIKRALVLGTGGASKAVAHSLRGFGIEATFVSRNPGQHDTEAIGYEDLTEEVISKNLLIVNTTPLGMYPKTEAAPDIPYRFITANHICYDLVYNPELTLFMKKSAEHGATVKNGLEMLHRQAEKAWEIWNRDKLNNRLTSDSQ